MVFLMQRVELIPLVIWVLVLSSTGTGLNWINAGDANVASSNVGTNDASSTNSTHYLAFIGATSGNNPNRVDIHYNIIHQ